MYVGVRGLESNKTPCFCLDSIPEPSSPEFSPLSTELQQ